MYLTVCEKGADFMFGDFILWLKKDSFKLLVNITKSILEDLLLWFKCIPQYFKELFCIHDYMVVPSRKAFNLKFMHPSHIKCKKCGRIKQMIKWFKQLFCKHDFRGFDYSTRGVQINLTFGKKGPYERSV